MRSVATPAARWFLALAITVWGCLSLSPGPRPDPVPANAPAPDFSAERAIAIVSQIAQKPHPLESAEHDRVRDYVRAELAKLGLESTIQAGAGTYSRRTIHVSHAVENIVARLSGSASSGAVMLVSHYDSVRTGPGAGDDGHGVAVLLETLRALRSGPGLRNDVIFLFTDGEEAGLLGADLFVREHPWRRDPAIVLNFEARGTGGPSFMFETSPGNEWMIRALQAAVPKAQATSVAYEIYRRMHNDTDLTVFKWSGLAGLNFAFIEHPEFYHRPQDDLAHLDPRSVQEQGRYALSLAREFGNLDLKWRSSGNAVYFPLRFASLIVYPESWVLPIEWIALAGLVAALWVGRGTRGRWVAAPLGLVGVLGFLLAATAPGADYMVEWPLLAGVLSFGLLVSAPPVVKSGWRVLVMALCPAAVFLLLMPFLSSVIVALGPRGAAPILAVAIMLMLVCLAPQLVLILRSGSAVPPRLPGE